LSIKVLILGGVGAVGSEATIDFVETSDVDEIVIGDYNIDSARKLVSDLNDRRVSAVKVDVNDIDNLYALIKEFNYVINALPFKYDFLITKVAVETGVSGVDVATEMDQFTLDEDARRRNVVFVPGMGATPGITNLMAKKGAEMIDEIDTIEIFWAAFRCTAPSPGLLYVTIWEFDPDLEERVIYENGEYIKVPPYSGVKKARFFELIGERETVFVPHSEVYTLPKYLDKPVKNVYVRGTWPDETMSLLKTLLHYNFYKGEAVRIDGVSIKPMDFIYKYLLQSPYAKRTDIWGYGLLVKVYGYKNGRRVVVTLRNRHPDPSVWGGERAYFKNVGIPLSIGMQLIIKGNVKDIGVIPPEAAYDPDEFFYELGRRGIDITWDVDYL
jgi:saccharopine dehydrogenase-like NADP-dependent oxidoreductase